VFIPVGIPVKNKSMVLPMLSTNHLLLKKKLKKLLEEIMKITKAKTPKKKSFLKPN